MRLIDADEVLNLISNEKVIETNSNEVAYNEALEVAIQIIDTQKTVKAISIEWIEKQIKKALSVDSVDLFYAGNLKHLIKEWEKENEES